jgi:hypothetical protein
MGNLRILNMGILCLGISFGLNSHEIMVLLVFWGYTVVFIGYENGVAD